MGLFLLIASAVLAGLGLLHSFLLGLQTWEHRRFARSRLAELDRCRATGRAMIFVPCKGVDVGLEENLRRFFHQDYDDYEITFVVESPWDAACDLIAQVMGENPHRTSHLVVAGRAKDCGQKVHNLRLAIQRKLSEEIEFLVFADSDARPGPCWLRAILARLASGKRKATTAATGYRWLLPMRPTLANHLLYSINCNVAMFLGPRQRYPIWGGSWALRRSAFEATELLDAWRGTLSDDLVATNVLRRHELGVRYEPACMVASPVDGTLLENFRFLRRQYLISRVYVPSLWLGGLTGSLIAGAGWLSTLAVFGWAAVAGSWLVFPSAGVVLALYGLDMARASIRQDLVNLYVPDCREQLRRAVRFDIWANPLAGLFNALAMVASCVGWHIRWRDITYRLQSGGIAQIVAREPGNVSRANRQGPIAPETITWPELSGGGASEDPRRTAA